MMKIRLHTRSLLVALAIATLPSSAIAAQLSDEGAEVAAVKAVLASYNTATQKLDVSGTKSLFASDSEIVEGGSVEGTFSYYLEHHIGPELREFKSFAFSDYKVAVKVEGGFAFATESFRFRIDPKAGDPVDRLAVATSVLRRTGEGWQILRYHWSSRRADAAPPKQ